MIALLRGVTPTGRNSIQKMSYCAEILENSGLSSVKTYIQSGNIIFSTEKDEAQVQKLIHDIILEKIGANLSVIIKKKGQLENAINECPFEKFLDASRIHLVFTNDKIDLLKLNAILQIDFGAELFAAGNHCLYMYLPREASKKVLNNTYLERKLGAVLTMRKINVVKRLVEMDE
ncbi:DUF1697 domain-containing protein [Treponema pectinovorum]|uniref:DUF1697 domain-containing protein n=1 Tax=Treponema pectinovorum TaxID=164 RepID=UPI0011C9DB02|nr:DUF1697 domain-containing protein [Treponema pectinovorum]